MTLDDTKNNSDETERDSPVCSSDVILQNFRIETRLSGTQAHPTARQPSERLPGPAGGGCVGVTCEVVNCLSIKCERLVRLDTCNSGPLFMSDYQQWRTGCSATRDKAPSRSTAAHDPSPPPHVKGPVDRSSLGPYRRPPCRLTPGKIHFLLLHFRISKHTPSTALCIYTEGPKQTLSKNTPKRH